jgi:APA family basic amino acid/polyamine antiporter
VLFAGVAVAALFVLRAREPDAPRPFRAWGYPVAPAIFTLASALIVLNALWSDVAEPLLHHAPLGSAAAGSLVIALGLPMYLLLRRRSAGRL